MRKFFHINESDTKTIVGKVRIVNTENGNKDVILPNGNSAFQTYYPKFFKNPPSTDGFVKVGRLKIAQNLLLCECEANEIHKPGTGNLYIMINSNDGNVYPYVVSGVGRDEDFKKHDIPFATVLRELKDFSNIWIYDLIDYDMNVFVEDYGQDAKVVWDTCILMMNHNDENYNIYDTKTKSFLFDEWVYFIEPICDDNYMMICFGEYDRNVMGKDRKFVLVDNEGNPENAAFIKEEEIYFDDGKCSNCLFVYNDPDNTEDLSMIYFSYENELKHYTINKLKVEYNGEIVGDSCYFHDYEWDEYKHRIIIEVEVPTDSSDGISNETVYKKNLLGSEQRLVFENWFDDFVSDTEINNSGYKVVERDGEFNFLDIKTMIPVFNENDWMKDYKITKLYPISESFLYMFVKNKESKYNYFCIDENAHNGGEALITVPLLNEWCDEILIGTDEYDHVFAFVKYGEKTFLSVEGFLIECVYCCNKGDGKPLFVQNKDGKWNVCFFDGSEYACLKDPEMLSTDEWFDNVYDIDTDFPIIEKNGEFTFVNAPEHKFAINGKSTTGLQIPLWYDDVQSFEEKNDKKFYDYFNVEKDGEWKTVDQDGDVVEEEGTKTNESLRSSGINEAADEDFSLQELSSIPSFAGRLRYCSNHLGYRWGTGTSRTVFDIDDDTILKLALNNKGIAQNREEEGQSSYSDIVVKVLDSDEEDRWLVEERCVPARKSDFKHVIGVSFDEVCEFVLRAAQDYDRNAMRRYVNLSKERFNELIQNNEFFESLYYLMADYQLPHGDLRRISSWGLVYRDGETRIVILDAGLTEDVYNQYYNKWRKNEAFVTNPPMTDSFFLCEAMDIEDKFKKDNGKYKNLTIDDYKDILSADPTAKNGNTGKYADWLLPKVSKAYSKGIEVDLNALRLSLEQYNDGKERNLLDAMNLPKDINSFKTIDDFLDAMGSVMNFNVGTTGADMRKLDNIRDQYEIVKESANWYVVKPLTWEAERYFGSHTKWCTVGAENYFKHYTNEGPLFITMPKDKSMMDKRMQFHFESGSFADVDDDVKNDPISCMSSVVGVGKSLKELIDMWCDIRYDFDERYFYDGFARVMLEDKYNFINKRCELLSEEWFDGARDFQDGFARVMLEDKYNFINTDGDVISKQWFDAVVNFYDGFASVGLKGKWNIINTDGDVISKQWLDSISIFQDGLATVKLNDKYYYMDTKGNLTNIE